MFSTLALYARGLRYDPGPCHHACVWDMLITTPAGSDRQTKDVKMGTGSVQANPQLISTNWTSLAWGLFAITCQCV